MDAPWFRAPRAIVPDDSQPGVPLFYVEFRHGRDSQLESRLSRHQAVQTVAFAALTRWRKSPRRKNDEEPRSMRFPSLLQQLLDRGPEALRGGIRGETDGRVACPVNQELGEVPLDGPGTERPALLVLQVLVKRMGAEPFTSIFANIGKVM